MFGGLENEKEIKIYNGYICVVASLTHIIDANKIFRTLVTLNVYSSEK